MSAQASPQRSNDSILLVLIGVVVGLGVLFWATTGLAALLESDKWAQIPFAQAPRAMMAVSGHLSDPAAGYPPALRAYEPGAVLWWVAFGLVLAVLVLLSGVVGKLKGALQNIAATATATWAKKADLKQLRLKTAQVGRLVLGKGPGGLIATEQQRSVMVIGPEGSMKTTGIVIPSVLEWQGPVIVVTVKGDVIDATYKARAARGGRILNFDPTNATKHPRTGWSPLRGCKNWEEAERMAAAMASAAQTSSGADLKDDAFWYGGAASVLALYLYATASAGGTIDELVNWVSTQNEEEIDATLDQIGNRYALDAWAALWSTRDDLRRDYFATAVAALRSFSSQAVRETLRRDEIDFEAFLDGGAHTIYVSAPLEDQERFRPLFSAFLTEAIDTIYSHAARKAVPDPPVLIVIDEAANVAPLAQLPNIASTIRSQGAQLITVWQDMAQVEERYGTSARTLFNNHRAKLLLSGCTDLTTLQYWANLLGEAETQEVSTHRDTAGFTSSTQAPRRHNLAPVEWIRQMQPGDGLLVYGHIKPAKLKLRVSWKDKDLLALADGTPVII